MVGEKGDVMIFDFIIRLALAGVLGAIIGLERELRSKEAGLRTHFLVAVGSALIMIIPKYGFQDVLLDKDIALDPSRIAAQVVSGIGFLGAGTIIIQKQYVRGLTTAAGIWATSGIGLTIGAGMYTVGLFASVLVLIGLEILSRVFKISPQKTLRMEIEAELKSSLAEVLNAVRSNMEITTYLFTEHEDSEPTTYHYKITGKLKKQGDELLLYTRLNELPHIKSIKIE